MRKKFNLQIEESASTEINDAYLWYEEQSSGLGNKFLKTLERAFSIIQKSPNGYERFDRHRQYPLKEFPFIILYEIVKDTLYIDAVFHTSRNPDEKIR